MSKFNASTPLETVLRVFPGFPRVLSGATEEQLAPFLQRAIERRPQETTLKDFCAQTQGSLDLDLEKVLAEANEHYLKWIEIEISPEKLKTLLENPASQVLLIDVREPWEQELVSLPGSLSFQSMDLPELISLASRNSFVILYCQHGVRSLYAATYLREQGVPHALSLQGGIDAFAETQAHHLRRY